MAYASLISLVNIFEEYLEFNLIPQNSSHIKNLLQKARFFQDFLVKYSHKINEKVICLETRIIDAAYKAQDIIESLTAEPLDHYFLENSFEETAVNSIGCLFHELDEEINSIKPQVMQIEEEHGNNNEHELQSIISFAAGSSTPLSHGMSSMVGLDDDLMKLKTRLISDSLQREVVALVGMGGIGKTTLAQKVYNEKSILSRFDIFGWATISQEYNVQNILLGLLDSMGKLTVELRIEDQEKLAEVLYKNLKHRRYLITLDDVWDTQVWDYLKRILANDENGSRILLTTRLNQVAEYDNNCPPFHVRFLNDEESWGLFCEKVFGKDRCPLPLEEVGKEIVRNCRGLPLAVNVIGGHLSKATRTSQYWKSVAKNLSETMALEDDDQCSRVLSLSYKYLPHHLKGCFLYMSIFPEDYKIEVSQLVHLWIASGLIKEERSKSFEDVIKDYLLDLVDRNLILVSQRKYNGKILTCKIHDLIRDLCVKEAKSQKFFDRMNKTTHLDDSHHVQGRAHVFRHSRLLRALYVKESDRFFLDMENQPTNLRFFYHKTNRYSNGTSMLTPKFLHLHTIHACSLFSHQLDIWKMPQLRHVKMTSYVSVPNPSTTQIDGGNSVSVLRKLQRLCCVRNLIFTDEVLRRIQNIKKLAVQYAALANSRDLGLNNLEHLQKLESLQCCFYCETSIELSRNMCFPPSIKKLTLERSKICWKDMTIVGSLPNLQVLKLKVASFVGKKWEPNEGEFLNLKTLYLERLNVVHWRADADHFPELQHLFIRECRKLLKIPRGFGGIPTLQLIDLFHCTRSVETSARQIEEDQHNFGNDGIQVNTRLCS